MTSFIAFLMAGNDVYLICCQCQSAFGILCRSVWLCAQPWIELREVALLPQPQHTRMGRLCTHAVHAPLCAPEHGQPLPHPGTALNPSINPTAPYSCSAAAGRPKNLVWNLCGSQTPSITEQPKPSPHRDPHAAPPDPTDSTVLRRGICYPPSE